jgi:stage IV sporulation protein FA
MDKSYIGIQREVIKRTDVMSNRRRKEILKRIQKRKKTGQRLSESGMKTNLSKHQVVYPDYEESHDFTWGSSPNGMKNGHHPLFNRDIFLFKFLFSAILVLVVAISFKMPSPQFEPVRQAVHTVMNTEFQFAAISDWYEKTFGQPLALFPLKNEDANTDMAEEYAVPATGVILESFDTENNGVVIQTVQGAGVDSIQDGTVIFAGVKEDYGHTVIIQHADNTETWYGKLGEIEVKVYDKVKAGERIGTVRTSEDEHSGEFYFAIKQGEKFIDPVQVIKFE